MAKKAFQFVAFEPMLWDNPNLVNQGETVLDVYGTAPKGSPRTQLKTKVYSRSGASHDAFSAFVGIHDTVRKIQAYSDSDDSGTDDDRVQERIYVGPSEFHMYELSRNPGWLYATASENVMKQMLRRYRETSQNYGTVFRRRIVQVENLEKSLTEMEIVGYTLANVRSTTPISSLDVLGLQMEHNSEVQSAKGRAGTIRAITFDLQSGSQTIRARVAQNGSVTFTNYPGDHTALTVLDKLEPYIYQNSDMESVEIRQSRGS